MVASPHVPGLLVVVILLGGGVAGCGSSRREAAREIRWHAVPVPPPADRLPPPWQERLAGLALPEITWTGKALPSAGDGGRTLAAVDADGGVYLGDRTLTLRAPDRESALAALTRWWSSGPHAAAAVPEPGRSVELYVDRASSWDHVSALLAFLAGPAHRVSRIDLVASRDGTPVGLPLRLGLPREGYIVAASALPFEDEEGGLVWDDASWREALPDLPPPREGDDRYAAPTRSVWFGHLRFARAGGRFLDALRLGSETIQRPGDLADPEVIGAAIEGWRSLARASFLGRYDVRTAELVVPQGAPEHANPPTPRVPSIPTAYVVQVADLAHAHGMDAEEELLGPLRLRWVAPATLRGAEPGVPIPRSLLASLGVAFVLGVALVFSGGRRWTPMRRTSRLIALLLPLAAMATPARADLSERAQAFLDAFERAGWTGHSSANGVDLTVRSAPLCSAGMLDAIRDGRHVLDAARVVLPESGWFANTPLPAGTYHLGLAWRDGSAFLTAHDEAGKEVASQSFWILDPTEKEATGGVSAVSGAAKITITAGNIDLVLRFVPKAQHDALVDPLTTIETAPLRLHTDLAASETMQGLARDAAASLPVHASLLGIEAARGPYDVVLTADAQTFEALDALLTGGEFRDTWAFTSKVTGWSYLRYGPMNDAEALSGFGLPLYMRALVLHEVHHAVANQAFPHGTSHLPDWLIEGLAEEGARRALANRSRQEGEAFHDLMLGRWRYAAARGAVPPLPDLLGDCMDTDRTGYYTTAYLMARELAAKAKPLHELVAAVAREAVGAEAAIRATDVAAGLFGSLADVLARAEDPVRRLKNPPPALTSGYLDVADGDVWRITSAPGSPGRVVLLPAVGRADGVTVKTTFSWQPSGQQQFDLYLALQEGRHTESFLKLAVLPAKAMLFWFRYGTWRTLGQVAYEKALAVGTPTEPAWHDLTVSYDVKARTVRLDTTGGRWALFDVPAHVPTDGTHVALGVYNGIVHVKRTTVR